LLPQSFACSEEYCAIQKFKASSVRANLSSTFARIGWFCELRRWVSEVLRPLGYELAGPFKQFNGSRSFSLIRFETSGPAVWFKAVGDPNRHEFGITLTLTELFPEPLVKIIGARPDWRGWLSFEAEGANLAETQQISQWQNTAASLARLQIASISKVGKVAASGARDLSIATLLANLDRFFELVTQLMRQQSKAPPPILNASELQSLKEITHDCLFELKELHLPDTVGHLDLNPGNIISRPSGCTFLDWAEAYVGSSLFSFQYLLEHFRRTITKDEVAVEALTTAYTHEWQGVLSHAALDEGLQLSALLAVYAYAVRSQVCASEEMSSNPSAAGYLRSLARRMNREAKQLDLRKGVCLS